MGGENAPKLNCLFAHIQLFMLLLTRFERGNILMLIWVSFPLKFFEVCNGMHRACIYQAGSG